jgi:DNA-binding NarL/FixJ family response regulator
MTTVLICGDSARSREAVRRVVGGLAGVDRIELAASGEAALAASGANVPDLVLMDVRMPGLGGLETARRMRIFWPALPVLMLTTGEDMDGVARAVAEGAVGYVLKDASSEELAAAVALALPKRRDTASPPETSAAALTDREREVLTGMSRGRSNAEIGRELYLSEDTVKTHARRLFRKLGASDRAHAVALGFRSGLVR